MPLEPEPLQPEPLDPGPLACPPSEREPHEPEPAGLDGSGERRRVLVEARRENVTQVHALERDRARLIEATTESNADDEHDPEGATLAFEREQLTAMLDRARQTGAALDQALTDLDDGDYGRCEQCGRAIDPARLEARPQARSCIDCARASRQPSSRQARNRR